MHLQNLKHLEIEFDHYTLLLLESVGCLSILRNTILEKSVGAIPKARRTNEAIMTIPGDRKSVG